MCASVCAFWEGSYTGWKVVLGVGVGVYWEDSEAGKMGTGCGVLMCLGGLNVIRGA